MRKADAPTLGNLLESFFRRRLVAQRRASPATIATYRDALKLLLVFAGGRCGKPPSRLAMCDLDRDTILDFLDHLEKQRGNSARTRNARLTAVRSFFQYVAYTDPEALGIVQRVLMIPSKRTVKPVIRHLTLPELSALLAAPDRRTVRGRRDYALLLFLGETGARVSEATGVDAADLRCDRPCQVLLRGKGSKERVVPLKEGTAAILRALREERGLDAHDVAPLFANGRAERLTRFGVTHVVRRAVRTAREQQPDLGRRTVSPHVLRHTAAMNLLRGGVDLTVIRSWLGHVNLDTTHHYLEADVEMKRRALEQCRTAQPKPRRYRVPDPVLAMLEELQ
jgi:site-specific recombinase XerD